MATPIATAANRQAVEDAESLALRFKALADPSRVRILGIVASSPNAETCVCDLSEPLGIQQPTVSHHLKILVKAGLLGREQRGVWAYYSLTPGALGSLASALMHAENQDEPRFERTSCELKLTGSTPADPGDS